MSTHKGIFKNSDLESISSKLKFISMLEPGQKISVTNQAIQDNTYWTSLVRSLTGENRSRVYSFISDVIQDSLNILEGLSNSNNDYDIQICKNLISDLILLGPGLTNLQETYKLDRMYVSKIKTLMENLEVKIQELCAKREIDYDQVLADTQKKMLEKKVVVQSVQAPLVSSVSSSSGGESEKKEVELAHEVEIVSADGEKKKTEGVLIPNVSNCISNCDITEAHNIIEIEKVAELERIPVLQPTISNYTAGKTVGANGANGSNDSTSGLVSYLRSLPSEDLLLMSTHTSTSSASATAAHHENESRAARRKRNKKQAYQYDAYYMSTPDDITLCNEDLEKGIIR